MTEPPPSVEYSAQSTQWEIFDGYIEDMERKKEADKKKGKKGAEAKEGKEKEDKKDADVIHSEVERRGQSGVLAGPRQATTGSSGCT